MGTIAISLDGVEETHDYMRKKGAFKHVVNALKMMKEKDINGGVITTVSKKESSIFRLNWPANWMLYTRKKE